MRVCMLAIVFMCCGSLRAADEPAVNGRTLNEWLAIVKDDPLVRKRRVALLSVGQLLSTQPEVAAKAIPVVLRAMKSDANNTVRAQAATILGQQSAEVAATFVTDFAEAIRNEKDTEVRRELALAVGRYGKLASSAVLPLVDQLKDSTAPTRAATATALGRIGPDANAATTALIPLVRDRDRSVKLAAIFALGRIEPRDSDLAADAILEALTEAAKVDPTGTVVGGVASRRDTELVSTSLTALGLLGEKSPEVVKAVAKYLRDGDVEIRQLAAITLGKFGVVARIAGEDLQTAFTSDADKLVRQYALRALCRATVEPNATTASEALTKLIQLLCKRLTVDQEFEVRIAIAEELGGMGALAKSAIPTLNEARRDAQLKVREAAANAIRQIEKPPQKPKTP